MSRKQNGSALFLAFVDGFHTAVPHLSSWMGDEDQFIELRIKLKDDGSCLAVAKGYGPDGGKLVCFGVGYGVLGACFAIDRTIQGGNWRVDKPWPGKGK